MEKRDESTDRAKRTKERKEDKEERPHSGKVIIQGFCWVQLIRCKYCLKLVAWSRRWLDGARQRKLQRIWCRSNWTRSWLVNLDTYFFVHDSNYEIPNVDSKRRKTDANLTTKVSIKAADLDLWLQSASSLFSSCHSTKYKLRPRNMSPWQPEWVNSLILNPIRSYRAKREAKRIPI